MKVDVLVIHKTSDITLPRFLDLNKYLKSLYRGKITGSLSDIDACECDTCTECEREIKITLSNITTSSDETFGILKSFLHEDEKVKIDTYLDYTSRKPDICKVIGC